MKSKVRRIVIVIAVMITTGLYAQNPPHPNGGGGPGGGNVPVGGGAPLDGGMLILSCLSIGYAYRKRRIIQAKDF